MIKILKKHTKGIIAGSAFFLIMALSFIMFSRDYAVATNLEVKSDLVRVALGQRHHLAEVDAREYVASRETILSRQVKIDPNAQSEALITFDDYYSENDLLASEPLLSLNSIEIKDVYIWMPGETGRAIVSITKNDIAASVEKFLASLDYESSDDETFKNDMIKLRDEWKIFAISVSATNSVLHEIAKSERVFADIFYNEEAEKLASERDIPVSYICIPDKPDGTQ